MFLYQLLKAGLRRAYEIGAYCYKVAKRLAEPTPYAKGVSAIRAIEKGSFRDSAFGAFFGSFVGDACGAATDKTHAALTKDQVEKAMRLRGGSLIPGTKLKFEAGQVTGVSEVQLCLIHGLVEANQEHSKDQEKVLDLDCVAKAYK